MDFGPNRETEVPAPVQAPALLLSRLGQPRLLRPPLLQLLLRLRRKLVINALVYQAVPAIVFVYISGFLIKECFFTSDQVRSFLVSAQVTEVTSP